MNEPERFWQDAGNHYITDFPLTPNSVVFDVGGYLGDFTDYIRKQYDCWIYVYEPVEVFYQQICSRFSEQSKIRTYQYGLEDKSKQIQLATMADGTSAHLPHRQDEKFVWFHDIAEELKTIGLPNLLALNVEGSEYAILERLIGLKELQNIDHVLVQFHNFVWDCDKRRNAIREKLRLTHRENFCYDFVWESWSKK